MRVFYPVFFSIAVITIFSLVEITLLKRMHTTWWARRWVRLSSYAIPVMGFFALTAWSAGIFSNARAIALAGSYATAVVLIIGLSLMISLPLSGLLHRITERTDKRREGLSVPVPRLMERRAFLMGTAAALPIAAVATGSAGLAGSLQAPEIPEIPLSFATLPPALDGYRIAHISDVHLGLFLGLPDFERMVERVARAKPDLVLLTGDIADDPLLYPDALRLAASIPCRSGVFASLGNHEYFRDITAVHAAYERGPVPLLLNAGRTLSIGGATLYVAGLDDPRSLGRIPEDFFLKALDLAMQHAPSNAFTLLLSHRPEGFNAASELSIPLTISGHTHGGQIGFLGRSVFEELLPERYMWGAYERNGSRLYTSAGAGHWFPYRLGCPAEIPLYILKREELRPVKKTPDSVPELRIKTGKEPAGKP
jgi:uncharacterized protein